MCLFGKLLILNPIFFFSSFRYIVKELKKIDGIRVIGDPQVSVVAIDSERFNVYALSDGMKKRGWNLNALQFPSSIHLCCTMLHTQVRYHGKKY